MTCDVMGIGRAYAEVFPIADRSDHRRLGDRDPALYTHREIDAAMRLIQDGIELRWWQPRRRGATMTALTPSGASGHPLPTTTPGTQHTLGSRAGMPMLGTWVVSTWPSSSHASGGISALRTPKRAGRSVVESGPCRILVGKSARTPCPARASPHSRTRRYGLSWALRARRGRAEKLTTRLVINASAGPGVEGFELAGIRSTWQLVPATGGQLRGASCTRCVGARSIHSAPGRRTGHPALKAPLLGALGSNTTGQGATLALLRFSLTGNHSHRTGWRHQHLTSSGFPRWRALPCELRATSVSSL